MARRCRFGIELDDIAASSPTTQASCPASTTTTCGAMNSKAQPSAYSPRMWPRPEADVRIHAKHCADERLQVR